MKKQILFLAIFTLAVFLAGTNEVMGQQLLPSANSTAPDPLSCDGNDWPLHPLAGKPYFYRLNNVTGDVTSWTWFATKDPNFVTGRILNPANRLTETSGQLIDAGSNYNVASNAAGSDSVMITWSPEILAATEYQAVPNVAGTAASPSPTFVVGYADGNCSNNLQVYEINPVVLFTVDIANIDASNNTMAYGADTSQCVDVIQSAIYNGASDNNEILMDYGADTMYFEVVAANFVTNWVPYITATGGWTSPQTATMDLFETKGEMLSGTGSIQTTTLTSGTTVTGPTLTADASVTSTVGGVSLWIRIIIDNNTYESLAAQTLSLTIDGQDSTNQWDMAEDDCADPTAATQDELDVAQHTVDPRPTLNDNTQDDGVVAPNDVIIKTP